jgi:hypothetical protein
MKPLLLAALLASAPALAGEKSLVTVDGHEWLCQQETGLSSEKLTYCFSPDNGEQYEGTAPLTEDSLKAERERQEADGEEAACACSRRAVEGGPPVARYFCTGAFSPYELRKRKTDPCALPWPGAGLATGGLDQP